MPRGEILEEKTEAFIGPGLGSDPPDSGDVTLREYVEKIKKGGCRQ